MLSRGLQMFSGVFDKFVKNFFGHCVFPEPADARTERGSAFNNTLTLLDREIQKLMKGMNRGKQSSPRRSATTFWGVVEKRPFCPRWRKTVQDNRRNGQLFRGMYFYRLMTNLSQNGCFRKPCRVETVKSAARRNQGWHKSFFNKKMDDLTGGGTKRRQSLQFIAFLGKSLGTRFPGCPSSVHFHPSLGLTACRPAWRLLSRKRELSH